MNANLCFICINELLYEKVCNAILILFLNVSSKKIFFFFNYFYCYKSSCLHLSDYMLTLPRLKHLNISLIFHLLFTTYISDFELSRFNLFG